MILLLALVLSAQIVKSDGSGRVMRMVSQIFEDNPEKLAQITMILGFENDPRYVRVLDELISNPEAFKSAALHIIEDMEESKKLPEYRKLMAVMYDSMLKGKDSEEIIDFEWIENDEAFQVGTQFNILRALRQLPKKSQKEIFKQIKPFTKALLQTAMPSELKKYAMNSLAIIEKHGRSDIIPETIVLAQLSWQTYQNILRWYNGEISGHRCAKNIIDDIATVSGGIGGSTVGG